MLPAIGAAALVLDAAQSLTSSASVSPQSKSQSAHPGASFSNAIDDSGIVAPGGPAAVSGLSGGLQISPGNFSALLDAQGHSSGGSASASLSNGGTPSGTASSTYNAVDQLRLSQSGTIPFGISPFSLSV